MKRRTLVASGVAMVALALTGCRAPVAPITVDMDVPNKNAKVMREAIMTAAITLGWTVMEDKPGYLVLQYRKGPHIAAVNVAYRPSNYKITMNNATNLREEKGVNPKFNQWVRNLDLQIYRNLALAQI